MTVILSQPKPPISQSGAKHRVINSSQIWKYKITPHITFFTYFSLSLKNEGHRICLTLIQKGDLASYKTFFNPLSPLENTCSNFRMSVFNLFYRLIALDFVSFYGYSFCLGVQYFCYNIWLYVKFRYQMHCKRQNQGR